MGQPLFLIGSAILAVLGLAHLVLSLLDLGSPSFGAGVAAA